jgi:hypothetical protein
VVIHESDFSAHTTYTLPVGTTMTIQPASGCSLSTGIQWVKGGDVAHLSSFYVVALDRPGTIRVVIGSSCSPAGVDLSVVVNIT